MSKRDTRRDVTRDAPPDLPESGTASSESGLSRRSFIKGVGGTAAAGVVLSAGPSPDAVPSDGLDGVRVANITLNVNGETQVVSGVEPRSTLLDLLRNRLEHTGAKPVCERASCGACSVLFDGSPVYSCSILALDAEGHDIVTVEGLASDDALHPVQAAFVEEDALMCGFCTPGFVVSVAALVAENDNPTLDEVKKAVSGNLCRCGTYNRVFKAAMTAARRVREGG
jgi:aerobic-type carbon monoxide dehydrogenase small subunit (CoxS/CutS family)